MAMTAGSVVEHFDVVEDIGPGEIPGFVNPSADAFFFQAAEERLRDGIVPAIAPPAHARFQVMIQAKAPEVIATVLTALVRVYDDPPVRSPAPHSHEQCVQHEFSRQTGTHR